MTTHPKLSKRMADAVAVFLERTPAARLNKNLRCLLMGYLLAYQDGHAFDMEDLLVDMTHLMELLDIAADSYPPAERCHRH